jgi:hypothetical protein
MLFNSLHKLENDISEFRIKSGDILQIKYDTKEALILVIEPNPPNNKNKLSAIKLKRSKLMIPDMVNLFQEIINLGTSPTPSELYTKFENSRYNFEENSYRTYILKNIKSIQRITIGQLASHTNKISLSNGSVLYGVDHANHVQLLPKEYETFKNELLSVNGNTFYEGPSGHEDVTIDLISFLYNGKIKSKSWEPEFSDDIYDRLYKVTELFGSNSDPLWKEINSIIQEREISLKNKELKDKTLVEIISETSGPASKKTASKKQSSWSRAKHSTNDIESLVKLSGVDSSILNKNFSSVTKSDFIEFHGEAQRRAFAQYEGEDYEKFIGSGIQKKATLVSRVRQRHLYKLMRKTPGIYFAGDSHVYDMENFIRDDV